MTTDPGIRIVQLQQQYEALDRKRQAAIQTGVWSVAEQRTLEMVRVNGEINRLLEQVRQERERTR